MFVYQSNQNVLISVNLFA